MNKQELLKKCHTISADPLKFLKKEKEEKSRNFIGYTCVFVPEELLHAYGYTPIRILGYSSQLSSVEKHLPSNCCEFARSMMQSFIKGDLDLCDMFVFSNCCDTLAVISDITSDLSDKPSFILNTPTGFNSETSKDFLNNELIRLQEALEKLSGKKASEESLKASWALYTKNYSLSKRLAELRLEKPGIISGYDSNAVIAAGNYLAKDEHNEILEELIKILEAEEAPKLRAHKMILSGSTNGNLEMIKLIEECGCIIVDDDLCETSRSIPLEFNDTFSFPETQSERIFHRFCPVKINDSVRYSNWILDKYKKTEARGVFFMYFPACDAQFIEYSYVKKRLGEENIKSYTIELVIGNKNQGQVLTRVEAFLESIR